MDQEQLLNLYQKFTLLSHSTKKACKEKQLKENESDKLFCFVLEFLLNTDKKTGISTAKLNKKIADKVSYVDFCSLELLIEYVLLNNTGTDDVVKTVQNFIDKQPETFRPFLRDILTKKFKCGVTAKVAAQIIPNVIQKEHQVMLANKFKGELTKPMQMSLKLDGIRCTALIDDNIKFLSRQGKEIQGLQDIQHALESMNLKGWMLDGELIRINNDNLPSEENFKLTTSIVSSKDDDKKGLEYVIFDIVPLEDYKKRESKLKYSERKELMQKLIDTNNDYVRLVPIYGIAKEIEDVEIKLDRVVNQGLEGLMLNSLDGLYKFGKRSNDLLKVKKFNTCDIKCTGIEEGEGKYEGTLGKIICDYKGYELRVGSGLTDEERIYYWDNPNEIIGKIVEIKYFEESSDKEGNISLRFPVFKCVREKDEISYE